MPYLVRMSCEYSTLVSEATSEAEALEVAEHRELKRWDEAWSEKEVEPYEGTTVPEESKIPEVICGECGSDEVEYAIWYSPNTDEKGDIFGSWGESDSSFCGSCQKHGTLIAIEARSTDKEKFIELWKKFKEQK